ncbi:hypothetical protein BOTBODRAFT_45406 [Botryobasidium botryosum FD-172 SS1]|uniref:NADH:flavin oxidoreductase/NADH oxidase N-terminal domain-containing protein n=1 Tax=Botryobasidium botryosum (strain FD-172 SS1) TaxID=930990 RepID=A0A067MCE5_BOTB1|nr:hypothetical protein BOTBODRAFT_45406 [Botryobasidium botryosum FD-172 SS1]
MTTASPKLFQPLRVGTMNLQHRVVMAPLTRFRADREHVHSQIGIEYYSQRGSTPGTLLISEGTLISVEGGGYANSPGIYTDDQVAAWKKITDAVHARGSYIYLQIAAMGRTGRPEVLSDSGFELVSASAIPLPGKPAPRALTTEEITKFIQQFAQAAHNAVFLAGFDGVEIHAASGHLIDQFTQDVSNKRTDDYGGSIENRARFALEVVKAVTDVIGETRTGIKFSPWNTASGMRMKDPIPTFTHLVESIREKHPNFAYLHFVEPPPDAGVEESNEFARKLWHPRPFFSGGSYDSRSGIKAAEERDVAVVYGRWFISNPDLPLRLKHGVPLTPFDTTTFYVPGPTNSQGYIDYPFADTSPQGIEVTA